MPDDTEIVLVVEGLRYQGWKEIEVVKSINNLATTFGFLISDKYPGDPNRWPIKLGQSCSVEINKVDAVKFESTKIAQGYIEEVDIRYDAGSHSLNFSGRDITGDLVDCCHYYDDYPNEWKKQSIYSIVDSLCSRFDIPVIVDPTVTTDSAHVIPSFKNNEGDRVVDLIARACMTKAILPVSYGDGKLTLTRAGLTRRAADTLKSGVNILSGHCILSNLDRHSEYVVKGYGIGNDDKDLASIVQPQGVADDNVILRHRPLVLLAEAATTNKGCEDRARWESRVRMGQSRLYSYDVQGWTQTTGDIWPLNGMVRVEDDLFGIEEELLIGEVTYRLSEDEGRKVRLTVVDPSSYELIETAIESDKATKFDYTGSEEELT
jgi:prophage tail gpP-like protein